MYMLTMGVGLALALALINTDSTNATLRESKMKQKCWNKKDAQGVSAQNKYIKFFNLMDNSGKCFEINALYHFFGY